LGRFSVSEAYGIVVIRRGQEIGKVLVIAVVGGIVLFLYVFWSI